MSFEIVLGAESAVKNKIAEILGHEPNYGDSFNAWGFVQDGYLLGGIVFYEYQPQYSSICIDIAADTPVWARRSLWVAISQYIFDTCKCQRAEARTAKSNRRCRKLLRGVGFTEEGTLRKALGTDSLCIYGILKNELPEWLLKSICEDS